MTEQEYQMMRQAELEAEIHDFIENRLALKEPVPANWVVHAIVGNHPAIEGDDLPWYRLCAYAHVRDTVRQVFRLFKKEEESESGTQAELFPGYEKLYRRYLVRRDGEQVIVPTEELTVAEIRGKAAEYRGMIAGLSMHAAELDRYADEREAQEIACAGTALTP